MTKFVGAVFALALAAPTAFAEPAKPAEPASATGCKRVVIGHRQGERQVICEIETPVIIHGKRLRPGVAVVGKEGRDIVGRPRNADRLSGLSQRLR